MAWVRGIKEARIVQPEREGKDAIPEPVRMIFDLPPSAISGTVRGGSWVLPLHTGAGPCGTSIKGAPCSSLIHRFAIVPGVARRGSPLAWSLVHLWPKLVAYYAAYEPPRRFGAKDTPRGRRFA